jgi:hypothetical protein
MQRVLSLLKDIFGPCIFMLYYSKPILLFIT